MMPSAESESIIDKDDLVLITGATGYVGTRLIDVLLARGLRNVRCLARPSSDVSKLEALSRSLAPQTRLQVMKGNLLSPADCAAAAQDVKVVYHLATSRDAGSYPDAFMNTVVTTRNLLDALVRAGGVRRFVNISSLAVYTNTGKSGGRLLDETCTTETQPELRGDAYCFAKVKQDEVVQDYATRFGIPHVIVRPGYVFGPGKGGISSRVGIGTFGLFLHMGGSNRIPLTYIDNCAEAIVMAGLTPGIDNQAFNIIDDDLPTSRQFLRQYKRRVESFRSVYLPHAVSYAFCYAWEAYAAWSEEQLPPAFNRRHWHAYWKATRYSNAKAKRLLGWRPRVSMAEGFTRYFESCRDGGSRA